MMKNNQLVEVKNLKKYFKVGKQELKAIDGVSFTINSGETLGLVGESGCGKSTVGRTIINLYNPTEGEVLFGGVNINKMKKKEKRELNKNVQMIFQDPYSALDPNMTVKQILNEPLALNKLFEGKERLPRIIELMEIVGLNPEYMNRYPHEFSGGQCQRIGIARALAVEPKFIICDEPISALDVSIQAQIINLLIELQEKFSLTYLFIAHDLSMVNYMSDRVAVMYLGKIVEIANSDVLFNHSLHPYTKALYSSIPIANPNNEKKNDRVILKGELPSPLSPPSGCSFRTRCPHATEICSEVVPKLIERSPNHLIACHNI